MRILTFTTLYPYGGRTGHGVFVENRLRHLVAIQGIEAQVIAPVPWFPFKSKLFGDYGSFADAPHVEVRHGIEIRHPRYLVVPKIGMYLTPSTLAHAGLRAVKQLSTPFDVIDAHYFYPDGVAAAILARELGMPFVITARGTDINVIGTIPKARALMREAGRAASAMIAVSQALKDKMVEIGLEAEKITVLRNGVDLDLFSQADREGAKARFGFERPLLLSVGRVIEGKGHHVLIEALTQLPEYDLAIAGTGPMLAALQTQARRLNVSGRVHFLCAIPHQDMPSLYSAADILILASQREGWPNVLLEALACGTPVIATPVGGIPECISNGPAGRLLSDRSVENVVAAVREFPLSPASRVAARAYAEKFSWDATSKGQMQIFESVVKQGT